MQSVKPSWPYSTHPPLYIRWHYALLPWRTNSGMNPQVIPVRHSQQSVTPSTSSVSTAQHTLCKVGLASSYPARSRYARQLLGLSSPTDAPLVIRADAAHLQCQQQRSARKELSMSRANHSCMCCP